MGSMQSILSFFSQKETLTLQAVNKTFYNELSKWMMPTLEMPTAYLVLEKGRKEISLGVWKEKVRHCGTIKLLSIGTEEG